VSGLPGGAVTFLFTDIEGSTRLVKALRERYGEVLAEHRRLIRAAIAGQAGHEVDTQGDAFFVAFAGAKQAVLCALEIQRALAGHAWPAGAAVRVRIGIHTGQAVPAEGGYTGLAVHRAARICAAARGAQVLVSQATQMIIEDEEEEPGFTLVDLGQRRLKDLDRPVRLFQLAAPGLDPPVPATTGQPGGGDDEAAGADGVVPRQLPTGAGFFAGREAELKELDALLDQADGESGAVVISAVAGMAGVGKTALAVHWAHRAAGRFPDGQLYVNLRGYDAEGAAVTPEEAAGWFLAALGVPAAQIPAGAQERCGLYRSVLAGRRVLIVLDNARDAAQVRPLLPGSPGCLVVVTSRSVLAGLAAAEGARPLRLGPLGEQEGVRMLAARLGPERVAAEPDAVAELEARCGHLPLALAVIAARAAADPGLPLGVLAGQLAAAADAEAAAVGPEVAGEGTGRLEVLETGDPATSLHQLLSWSHGQLSAPAAAMFALLGVHCGPDITVPAAASLIGGRRAEAGRALAELAGASLAAEHRPGRYVLHDLVRGYAAGHAREDLGQAEIRAAVERSLDHYLHTMVIFSSDIPWIFTPAPPVPGVVPEQLADEGELQDWARAEHQVLLQAAAQAAAAGLVTRAWQIFECQAWFLGGQGYWTDWRAAGQAVLAAAEAAGDHTTMGWTHMLIGRYGTFTGAHGEDRIHLDRALNHFRRAGDLPGQAWAHLFAGLACTWTGDWAEAVTHGQPALSLFRQADDRAGEGLALAGLAFGHAHLGNHDLARDYAQQAQELDPKAGDPFRLALAWNALGLVHSQLGEQDQAISCYRQALALAREWKTPMARRMLASVLTDFGDACRATRDPSEAVGAWQQALQILDDLRLPDGLGVRARLEQASPSSSTD
jgi:class 3 adenylate cyclase/tetratricopeptide (TPR) repeat protein